MDGTLISGTYGNMVWHHGIVQEYAKRHSISFEDAYLYIKNLYDSIGETDIRWYEIEYWLKRFDLNISAIELLNQYEDYIIPTPGAKEVLKDLSARYTLIVASNAARIFVEKELQHTGLDRYFSYSISATTDYRMVKKDRAFYELLCTNMKVEPHEVIHVGDHRVFDFEIPLSLGIDAYYYVNHSEKTDKKIESIPNWRVLYSLPELLKRV
jgi:putative hydrolase of the HAD superfamily